MRLLVVSGLSGAGKTTALQAFADLGLECVDNLPVSLLRALIETRREDLDRQAADRPTDAVPGVSLAVGIDARDRGRIASFPEVAAQLRAEGIEIEVLFLDAEDDVIVRRYSETRRVHPLGALPDAITKERALLEGVRGVADRIIDSSVIPHRELRRLVGELYGAEPGLRLRLMSFGFKTGIPAEADLVFDARFLANPFDVPHLRPLTGHDPSVRDYVLEQESAQELLTRMEQHLRFQLPLSAREGRTSLVLALGCTGGQHRSVALIEALAGRVTAWPDHNILARSVAVAHRDLYRETSREAQRGPASQAVTK